MIVLAAHPMVLPLTVFGLVLSLWLLGVLFYEDRKRRLSLRADGPVPSEPTWLQESLGADSSFTISDEIPGDSTEERREVRLVFVVSLVIFTLLWLITQVIFVALAVGALAYVFLRRLQSLRQGKKEVEEQASCLFAMRLGNRTLRAGHTLSGMFRVLARETPGSVGRTFAEIVHREELGDSTEHAISEVLLKSHITELRRFGLTILIQLGAGGDPSIVIDRLSQSMDERTRILRKTRTLLTYGRITAKILVVLMLVLFFAMSYLHDGYWEFLFKDPLGQMMFVICAILIVTGLILVQRYVRSDVVYSRITA